MFFLFHYNCTMTSVWNIWRKGSTWEYIIAQSSVLYTFFWFEFYWCPKTVLKKAFQNFIWLVKGFLLLTFLITSIIEILSFLKLCPIYCPLISNKVANESTLVLKEQQACNIIMNLIMSIKNNTMVLHWSYKMLKPRTFSLQTNNERTLEFPMNMGPFSWEFCYICYVKNSISGKIP